MTNKYFTLDDPTLGEQLVAAPRGDLPLRVFKYYVDLHSGLGTKARLIAQSAQIETSRCVEMDSSSKTRPNNICRPTTSSDDGGTVGAFASDSSRNFASFPSTDSGAGDLVKLVKLLPVLEELTAVRSTLRNTFKYRRRSPGQRLQPMTVPDLLSAPMSYVSSIQTLTILERVSKIPPKRNPEAREVEEGVVGGK